MSTRRFLYSTSIEVTARFVNRFVFDGRLIHVDDDQTIIIIIGSNVMIWQWFVKTILNCLHEVIKMVRHRLTYP